MAALFMVFLLVAFLVTDIISELYGKKKADQIVISGFVASVFVMLVSQSQMQYLKPNGLRLVRKLLTRYLVYSVRQFLHQWWHI